MDNTQPTTNQDGPSEAELTDPQVTDMYTNGLISRAEADVFNIIADFNDGQGGITCQTS
jgi:hypothetical protein